MSSVEEIRQDEATERVAAAASNAEHIARDIEDALRHEHADNLIMLHVLVRPPSIRSHEECDKDRPRLNGTNELRPSLGEDVRGPEIAASAVASRTDTLDWRPRRLVHQRASPESGRLGLTVFWQSVIRNTSIQLRTSHRQVHG